LPLTEPAFQLAEGDIFSIQGKGRFLFFANKGETKKGRLRIILQKYI